MTLKTSNSQYRHYNLARASLQQALSWYTSRRRHHQYPPDQQLQTAVKSDLQKLQTALNKLEQKLFRIAVMGLVSRGKSAVLNALVGKPVFETGAINGVTVKPQSIPWQLNESELNLELVDTPGLDEIDGEAREEMTRQIAMQSDLILFVVAGDITRTEYQALVELRQSHKPIIIVFNKIDLYPDVDRQKIYQQLQTWNFGEDHPHLLSPIAVTLVAADPQPLRIQIDDERSRWHTPKPQIESLRQTIINLLNREGESLLALNSLLGAKNVQSQIAAQTIAIRTEAAEQIIWQYARYKALAVAINPIAVVDLIASIATDLALIRTLAQLYGLPITNHQVGSLWRKIIFSSGTLLLAEVLTGLILGIGKSATAGVSLENPAAIGGYLSMATIQGAIAGYGVYVIGKAAAVYLQQGCSWGNLGASSAIKQILAQVESHTMIARLQQELTAQL